MVYAYNDGTERRDLWQKLEVIAGQCTGPWAVTGDFNTVITPAERLGANTKQADMDMEPNTRVFSRLDRFMVNQEWLNQFPNMVAHFHPEGLFDHYPCTVSNVAQGDGRRASFKYFNMWGKAPSFLPIITEEWQKIYPGHKMFAVIKKLKALKPALKWLNRDCYADIENSTAIVEAKLNAIQVQLAQDIQILIFSNKNLRLLLNRKI
ncbi:uncharacterized protein LOC141588430 [Silene latifolia]|uniref:uncharacterized protein LOC141588430 n=1 Tax=Silene latifolia TaxID=37657 RepID=UPI003D77304E